LHGGYRICQGEYFSARLHHERAVLKQWPQQPAAALAAQHKVMTKVKWIQIELATLMWMKDYEITAHRQRIKIHQTLLCERSFSNGPGNFTVARCICEQVTFKFI
jgi:hypothetical protein